MVLCLLTDNLTGKYTPFLPLFSSAVIIILFSVERFLTYGIRKKERTINWYYKIFIDPNITNIDDFYTNCKSLFKESLEKIKTGLRSGNLDNIKVVEIQNFQINKREFENDVILPFILSYSAIGEDLTNELLLLEDIYVEFIDKIDIENDYFAEFSFSLYQNKSKFYQILFRPIHKKSWNKKFYKKLKNGLILGASIFYNFLRTKFSKNKKV